MATRRVFRTSLQVGLIALLASNTLQAGPGSTHYRWLDDRGNPVHSDRPPPAGVDYEVISTRSGLRRVVPGEVGAVPREVEPRAGNEFETVQHGPDLPATRNPEICEIARRNLTALTQAVRVQVRNDQGEVVFLSDEERAVRQEEAESLIRQHCD